MMMRLLQVCTTAVLFVAASVPTHAQRAPVRVSAHGGLAVPADAYQSNCGHVSLAYGVNVQGRGRFFPQASVDHFVGSGGGDILCLPLSPDGTHMVGGLRIENATRIGLGGGARWGQGALQLEGVALGGVMVGRRGFTRDASDRTRVVVPHVSVQSNLVLLRHVVLSGTASWARLVREPDSGSGAEARTTMWKPLVTLQGGLRF